MAAALHAFAVALEATAPPDPTTTICTWPLATCVVIVAPGPMTAPAPAILAAFALGPAASARTQPPVEARDARRAREAAPRRLDLEIIGNWLALR